jgi:glycosyltransferase involved in cell wall biosynthesis
MLFSAVIPTFNRSHLLQATLESVFAQTFTDYEIIVVDDGSTDDTQEMVKSYGKRVQFFCQENAGPGAARNLGVSHARGEYVAFLDSDDLWFPWTLAVFAELIDENTAPSILAAKVFEFRQERELAALREESLKADRFTDYFASASKHYFVGATMTVSRREQLLQTGGFTEKRINAEDHDLIMRLGSAPGFVQVQSPYTLAYRRHETSETSNFAKTYLGIVHLLEQEKRGNYPGGVARSRERHEILTLHVRPVALAALKNRLPPEAWRLYRKTLNWHIQQGRWKFLLGFLLLAVMSFSRKERPSQKDVCA